MYPTSKVEEQEAGKQATQESPEQNIEKTAADVLAGAETELAEEDPGRPREGEKNSLLFYENMQDGGLERISPDQKKELEQKHALAKESAQGKLIELKAVAQDDDIEEQIILDKEQIILLEQQIAKIDGYQKALRSGIDLQSREEVLAEFVKKGGEYVQKADEMTANNGDLKGLKKRSLQSLADRFPGGPLRVHLADTAELDAINNGDWKYKDQSDWLPTGEIQIPEEMKHLRELFGESTTSLTAVDYSYNKSLAEEARKRRENNPRNEYHQDQLPERVALRRVTNGEDMWTRPSEGSADF